MTNGNNQTHDSFLLSVEQHTPSSSVLDPKPYRGVMWGKPELPVLLQAQGKGGMEQLNAG